MPRGAKPGERRGGRQKGTRNKATARREQEVRETGITPLEFLISVMRDKEAPREVRIDAAKSAAPYVHPKLSSVAHTGSIGTYDLSKLTDAQLDTLEFILAGASLAGANQGGEGEAER